MIKQLTGTDEAAGRRCLSGLQVLIKQLTGAECFCIHSASLCLLVGAFNPFTFKVIIDIYVPVTIFLIVWG